MAASQTTIKQIMDILQEEWPHDQENLRRLIGRLYHEVEGNQSVRATLKALWERAGCPRPEA